MKSAYTLKIRQTCSWLVAGLLLFVFLNILESCQKTEPKIKNVLLLFADDMGAHLGVMGERSVQTPTIDSLAAKGVLFMEAHSATASCSPSRSSLLTGMYPHSNGHWRNTITPEITAPERQFTKASSKLDEVGIHEGIPTLIEILSSNGYITGITQKWHLSPHWKFPFHEKIPAKGSLENVSSDLSDFFDETGKNPFFLQMNIENTHRPFGRGMVFADSVDPDSVEVPLIFPDTPRARRDLAKYYSTVNGVDQVVNRVLQMLKEKDLVEETLVIFSSDHGWPYHRAKASTYYMGTHVPLIISGPGITKKNSDALVSLIDIMPTILDYLDLPVPETVQGRSLKPLLEGKKPEAWRSFIYTEHSSHGPPRSDWYPSRAVFDGRYHYIKNLWPDKTYQFPADLTDESQPWNNLMFSSVKEAKNKFPTPYQAFQKTIIRPKEELYDVKQDPYALHNLADESNYVNELEYLRNKLDQWMENTEDPFNPAAID